MTFELGSQNIKIQLDVSYDMIHNWSIFYDSWYNKTYKKYHLKISPKLDHSILS